MLKITDKRLQLFLFVLAFLVYANTIGHSYAWDDSIVIIQNPRVKQGFSGIPQLFIKSHSDYIADKYGYRPIVLTSFAIEYALFKDKPQAGHFVNVVCFGLLCVVLFGLLRKIFYRLSHLGPLLITVLFIAHPLHVEVVANIKSRDELFALLFCLLSLSRLIDYYNSQSIKSLVSGLLLFLLAFLSKESAITFLAIVPLTLLYMYGRAALKKMLKPAIALAALLAVCLLILKLNADSTYGSELSKGAGIFNESGRQGNSFFYSYQPAEKLANALTVLMLYLKNFFYPATLVYFSGYNQIPVASWSQPLVLFSLAVHLAILLFALTRYRSHREICYGIFFYLITIFIYTHIFRTLADTMADRFMFTPSVGLCIAVVFALAALFKTDLHALNVQQFLAQRSSRQKNFMYLFLAAVVLLGCRTLKRNMDWKDTYTLVSHDMPDLENCARAHNYYADNLKNTLVASFDPATEAKMIHHYRRSYSISNESYYAYLGLSMYFCNAKRYTEAIALLDTMLQIYPRQADPHYYIGQAYLNTGSYRKAIAHLETSLELAPEVLNTYYTLSLSYSRNGEFEKAFATITKAREKFSESSYIYEALGTIYFDKGDMEQSTRNMLETLRFGADPKKVYAVVIGRYQSRKQDSLASVYYRQAVAQGIFRPGGQ